MSKRQIVLDTETTGLTPAEGHRVIEIGCMEMVNRRLTGRDFHRFLNPDRDIDEGAERVHGISRAFLADKPRFTDVVDEFLEFIRGSELVIHNAPFDIGFLDHELRLMRHAKPAIEQHASILDTLTLAREMHPGQRNSLDALCKRYEVDASGRDVHGALIDADLLARVYLAMTGGQTALFQEEEDEDDAASVTDVGTFQRDEGLKLIVTHASIDELAEHEAMLERMSESGKCLWRSLEPKSH